MSKYRRSNMKVPVGVTILVIITMIFVRGWALMIALGMIAGWSGLLGLAVGFWPAFALGTLLQIAFGKVSGSVSTS